VAGDGGATGNQWRRSLWFCKKERGRLGGAGRGKKKRKARVSPRAGEGLKGRGGAVWVQDDVDHRGPHALLVSEVDDKEKGGLVPIRLGPSWAALEKRRRGLAGLLGPEGEEEMVAGLVWAEREEKKPEGKEGLERVGVFLFYFYKTFFFLFCFCLKTFEFQISFLF
jgi:hypothetical protein